MAVNFPPISADQLKPVAGVQLGYAQAGIRKTDRKDLLVITVPEGASVAGVFTTNAFCAAPVHVSKKHLEMGSPRYLVINTGNANAGTGKTGMENAKSTCYELAALAGVEPFEILPFSTGVIGEQLPMERLLSGLQPALDSLKDDAWLDAAAGIMTTDTTPKGASEQFVLDGVTYAMTGISKGAGMIRPNMATMLSYVATDAPISRGLVQQIGRAHV